MSIKTDKFARQAKLFVDSGQDTVAEALERLKSLRVTISIGETAASSAAGQAAFLTAINIASRCFAGGVMVNGALDVTVLSPLGTAGTSLLQEALRLGAQQLAADQPEIELIIGNVDAKAKMAIHTWWQGWVAGYGPISKPSFPNGDQSNPLAAMAAVALGVGAAFRAATGITAAAFRTEQISLWSPNTTDDYGPEYGQLPNAMWLFGLGNLGQAFAWCISASSFDRPEDLTLYIQDYDRISEENWGTSVLVHEKVYGELKSFVTERFLRDRHFNVLRVDRALDEALRRTNGEPLVALCGLDKVPPRRWLGEVGFSYIVDVGLGASHTDYTRTRVYCFDKVFTPQEHFADAKREKPDFDARAELKGYQEIGNHAGRCGIEEYAGHSIAFTFVSCFAACLALAQLARLASGQATYSRTIIDTADIRSKRAVIGAKIERIEIGTVKVSC